MDDFIRQACIAALRLLDVRRRVLSSYIRSPIIARPHEIDLDIDLLLKVTFYANRRFLLDGLVVLSISVITALVLGLSEIHAWIAFIIVFIGLIVFIVLSSILHARWIALREKTLVPFFWAERFDHAKLPNELVQEHLRTFTEILIKKY